MKKLLLYSIIVLLILFPFAACGENSNDLTKDGVESAIDQTVNSGNDDVNSDSENVGNVGSTDVGKKKLSISVLFDHFNLEMAVEKFNEIHPDVEITLNHYHNDGQKYKEQIGTKLMAGQADDLLDASRFLDLRTAQSGYFEDLLPLMEKDPGFIMEDYYSSVFDGMLQNGKLFYFPTRFISSFIGVNSRISQELTDQFAQYKTISYRELLDLYNSLEDKGGRSLSYDMDAFNIVNDNFNSFIDLEKKECHFDTPEFIEFITAAKNAADPGKIESGGIGDTYSTNYFPNAKLEEAALKYLFINAQNIHYQFFLPYREQAAFIHFVPLVNDEGKVLMIPQEYYSINAASENKEIAWEFIKFLTTPEAKESRLTSSFPVNKTLFKSDLSAKLKDFTVEWIEEGHDVDADGDEQIDALVAETTELFDQFNAMPMEYQRFIDNNMLMDTMKAFHSGVMTAEQAASELQNKISIFLKEFG